MQILKIVIDFILHIDKHLQFIFMEYGNRIYGILFIIIFVETGLVIMPFLPGDSLLFVAGSLAGGGFIDIYLVLIVSFFASVIGDTVNYHIGKGFGKQMMKLTIKGKKLINPEHIEKTKSFFEKYGKKTIIIARFIPIVRTIAPFVAGISEMNYKVFISYNILGGLLWVFPLTLAGYFFGQMEIIKNNFEKVVFLIIFLSILPMLFSYIKAKFTKKTS